MLEDTSKVRQAIERALADGYLSRAESDTIKTAMYQDKQVTKEECKLFRELQQKIGQGEVILD
jgi:hypothetical protein